MNADDILDRSARSIDRARFLLSSVEGDLEVLGSEFCPNLHQINAQLDQLRREMDQDRLDRQTQRQGRPQQDPPPVPADPRPAQNGGQEPADDSPGQTMKQHE